MRSIISLERIWAAEYSRNLSEKVFHGCVEVSRQGFSAGGTACYGLERLLLDEQRRPVRALKDGEQKAIVNQRVTFQPRNDESTRTVQEIFGLCVDGWKTPEEIAAYLNERKVPAPNRRFWSAGNIVRILANQAYAGTRVYNKTWSRPRVSHPDTTVRSHGYFGIRGRGCAVHGWYNSRHRHAARHRSTDEGSC